MQGAARVILAVPVGAPDAVWALGDVADEVVCLHIPADFYAVGQWYRDFTQTSDDEVAELLRRAREGLPAPAMAGAGIADPPVRDEEVAVFAEPVTLAGHLTIPEDSVGLVVFAHGSGSSRHSPRNRYVADILHQAKLGTLLFDLLTQDEERDRARVFDIELLANRLAEVTVWLATQPEAAGLRIGYFGASTGAAAALCAATDSQVEIHAVVSRGGRPDLAASRLAWVRTPTLLIVGSRDEIVLDLNRRAQAAMHCETQLAVVPGATHLFEEPGTLRHAALLACDWFIKHLAPAAPSSGSKT
ncbi:MAG: dienelactone hydrolase family protein [Pseudonocardiaceae bacterium]